MDMTAKGIAAFEQGRPGPFISIVIKTHKIYGAESKAEQSCQCAKFQDVTEGWQNSQAFVCGGVQT